MKKIKKKNTITEEQREAWFKAVRKDNIKTIKKMLEDGFDVNCGDEIGWTALHYECFCNFCNHADTIKFLLDNRADVNLQNKNLRTTPLHVACCYQRIKIAKILINNGATITAKDIYGDTPLDKLKYRHHQKYEELMVWLTEHHPEKMLEYMANDKAQSRGVGL